MSLYLTWIPPNVIGDWRPSRLSTPTSWTNQSNEVEDRNTQLQHCSMEPLREGRPTRLSTLVAQHITHIIINLAQPRYFLICPSWMVGRHETSPQVGWILGLSDGTRRVPSKCPQVPIPTQHRQLHQHQLNPARIVIQFPKNLVQTTSRKMK